MISKALPLYGGRLALLGVTAARARENGTDPHRVRRFAP
jgi:hypothetical protein